MQPPQQVGNTRDERNSSAGSPASSRARHRIKIQVNTKTISLIETENQQKESMQSMEPVDEMAEKHIDTDYDEDEERKADEQVQVYYVKTEDHHYKTDQTLEERFQLLQMQKCASKQEVSSQVSAHFSH